MPHDEKTVAEMAMENERLRKAIDALSLQKRAVEEERWKKIEDVVKSFENKVDRILVLLIGNEDEDLSKRAVFPRLRALENENEEQAVVQADYVKRIDAVEKKITKVEIIVEEHSTYLEDRKKRRVQEMGELKAASQDKLSAARLAIYTTIATVAFEILKWVVVALAAVLHIHI